MVIGDPLPHSRFNDLARKYEQYWHHDGGRRLLSAILGISRPVAPPERSTREVLGLNLLRATFALEHVERVSETLQIVDASHVSRHLELDIDLGKIRHRLPSLELESWRQAGTTAKPEVWVPVGRHPRGTVSPIVPEDGSGNATPRMSSREANHLVAAGLISTLRMLAARELPDHEPNEVELALQWRVEAALLAIVRDGRLNWRRAPRTWAEARAAMKQEVDVPRYPRGPNGPCTWLEYTMAWLPPSDRIPRMPSLARTSARLVRRRLGLPVSTTPLPLTDSEAPGLPFLDLFKAVADDQVVVVRLDSAQTQHRVSYRAPELESLRDTRLTLPRFWGYNARQFTFEYNTKVPAQVESFHLTLEVPDDLEVRHMLLTSDADHEVESSLIADIETLVRDRPGANLEQFEATAAAAKVQELVSRRREDLSEYVTYVRNRDDNRAGNIVTRYGLRAWRRLSRWNAQRFLTRIADLSPTDGTATAEGLRTAATLIRGSELSRDLHVDRDARESAGHALWRRHGVSIGPRSDDAVRLRAFVSIVDSRPSYAVSAFRVLLLNLFLVIALLTAFAGIPALVDTTTREMPEGLLGYLRMIADAGYWRDVGRFIRDERRLPITGQSEVVVTLLLLVLGLIVRGERPPSRSLVNALRTLPWRLGWLAIIINALLAITITAWPAGEDGDPRVPLWVASVFLTALTLLWLASAVIVLNGTRQWQWAPPYISVPPWLSGRSLIMRGFRRWRPSARFDVERTPPPGLGLRNGRTPPAVNLLDETLRTLEQPIVGFTVAHDHAAGPWTSHIRSAPAVRTIPPRAFAPAEMSVVAFDGLATTLMTNRVLNGYTPDDPTGTPVVLLDAVSASAWSGRAVTAPELTARVTAKLDVLLTVREGEWFPAPAESDEMRTVLLRIMAAAAAEKLPVTFARTPAVGFRAPSAGSPPGKWDDPFHARAFTVRVTVGIDGRRPSTRLRFLNEVHALATTHGYGLHVADRGFGPLAGRWTLIEPVIRPSPAVPALTSDQVRTVTVLGPTRTGSFAAILGLITGAGLTVYSATCTTQQELTLGHAVVGRGGPTWPAPFAAGSVTLANPPMVTSLGQPGRPAVPLEDRVHDHVLVWSGPTTTTFPHSTGRHAMWASWLVRDVPPREIFHGVSAVGHALSELVANAAAASPEPRLDFLRMRRDGPITRVERMEFSVSLPLGTPSPDAPVALDALAMSLTRALETRRLPDGRIVRPRVSAREGRLGTWIDDPA